MRTIALTTLFSLALMGTPPAHAGEFTREVEKASQAFEYLRTGKFDAFTDASNDEMKTALPADMLPQIWQQVTGAFGEYKRTIGTDAEKAGALTVVVLHCEFEKSRADVTISIDASGKLAGLFFKPVQADVPYAPPNYVEPSKFTEQEVQFSADSKFPLSGTLTLPKRGGPFPAVVLVHGSGPHDRDETIFGNRPFKDIAWGLASYDVAVLRYDKRTKAHGGKMEPATITIDDETADDALAAARLLMDRKDIRRDAVFILGHSLGATAAPYIGSREPKIAGLIMLAAAARPVYELVDEQVPYIAQLDGHVDEAEQRRIEETHAIVGKLRDGTWGPTDSLLGVPAEYWAKLDMMKPLEHARDYARPMLILHGGRDYQVTDTDFKIWQKTLQSQKNVTLKRFESLDHLFRSGEGASTPESYMLPGSVDSDVIRTIGIWIRAAVPPRP